MDGGGVFSGEINLQNRVKSRDCIERGWSMFSERKTSLGSIRAGQEKGVSGVDK